MRIFAGATLQRCANHYRQRSRSAACGWAAAQGHRQSDRCSVPAYHAPVGAYRQCAAELRERVRAFQNNQLSMHLTAAGFSLGGIFVQDSGEQIEDEPLDQHPLAHRGTARDRAWFDARRGCHASHLRSNQHLWPLRTGGRLRAGVSSDSSVDVATIRNNLAVTVKAVPKPLVTKTVTIKGKGDAVSPRWPPEVSRLARCVSPPPSRPNRTTTSRILKSPAPPIPTSPDHAC